MKYHILLALEVEADPADFSAAAANGFQALADLFNDEQPVTLHLLPQDGSAEALLADRILACCFTASNTPSIG